MFAMDKKKLKFESIKRGDGPRFESTFILVKYIEGWFIWIHSDSWNVFQSLCSTLIISVEEMEPLPWRKDASAPVRLFHWLTLVLVVFFSNIKQRGFVSWFFSLLIPTLHSTTTALLGWNQTETTTSGLQLQPVRTNNISTSHWRTGLKNVPRLRHSDICSFCCRPETTDDVTESCSPQSGQALQKMTKHQRRDLAALRPDNGINTNLSQSSESMRHSQYPVTTERNRQKFQNVNPVVSTTTEKTLLHMNGAVWLSLMS